MNRSDLRTEKLPDDAKSDYLNILLQEMGDNENLTRDEYLEKLEIVLIDRARCTCKLTKQTSKCRCYSNENLFILAQFYFDTSRQRKAYQIFDTIKHEHKPSMYQLGVILYDDLIDIQDKNSDQNIFNDTQSTDGNETQASFLSSEQNVSNWEKGFQCMLSVAESEGEEHEKSMIHAAQFNVGMAYFSGFAVKQSNTEAEKWWLRAANDGDPKACVTAMTTLAFFYSQPIDKETFDLKKAFFWHNEACGNGSLESQGALGSMYYYGIGVKKNINAAYECLTNASERGNVYSMGILSEYYYKNKFFAKAFELSKRVANLNDIELISKETNCVKSFISRGVSLASFIQARCLDLGKGTKPDPEMAKHFYKRSFQFDPDLCQMLQNHTTLQKF